MRKQYFCNVLKLMSCIAIIWLCGYFSADDCYAGSDNMVHFGETDDYFYVIAYFNPRHICKSDDGYTLEEGKNVRQAKVRARSDGKKFFSIKICSSVDTGWMESERATSVWDNKIISTPRATVDRCWTCKQRTSYDWVYWD